MAEKVQYGKITMYRCQCPSCNEVLFQDNMVFDCDDCKLSFSGTLENLRIEVANLKRKYPSKKMKEHILSEQNYECYWCNREFYLIYFRYNSIKSLLPNYDHILPYSYSYSNSDNNFVAACNVCNSFKSSHVFEDEFLCKEYLKRKWEKALKKGSIVFLEEN